MERFFVVIGRINSVLLLLFLLGGGVTLAVMMVISALGRERPARALVAEKTPGTTAPVMLNLGQAERIVGSDTTMIALRSEGTYSKVASGQPSETRNILFLPGSEKNASWLFKNHRHLILATEQVRKKKSSDEHPALALYVQYVTTDTNGDGRLSDEDNAVIGLTKPDGSGFVSVVQDVSGVISYDMENDDQLSLVYQRGATIRHARFSLAGGVLNSV